MNYSRRNTSKINLSAEKKASRWKPTKKQKIKEEAKKKTKSHQ